MDGLSKRSTGQIRVLVYLPSFGSKHSSSLCHPLARNTFEPETSALAAEVLSDQQVRKASMTWGNFALSTLLSRCYRVGWPTHPKHFKQSFLCGRH